MRITENGLFLLALSSAALLACSGTVSSGGGGNGGATTSSNGGATTSSNGGATTGGTGGSTATGGATTGGTGGSTATGGATTGGTGGSTTTSSITTTSSTSITTTGGGDAVVLAIHHLLLGDTLPNGTFSSTAWKQYGMNIDGKVSTSQSIDLCKPAAGANKNSVYPDGNDGIDNSFGRNLMPIWTSLWSDFSAQVNDAIATGDFTHLFRIEGIGVGQTGTFPSQVYVGAKENGQPPSWQGTDVWAINSTCLVNSDPALPKLQFPIASVDVDAAGVRRWQSVTVGDLTLALPLSGTSMVLPIHGARITMSLSDDNAHATSGIVSGVIDTEEYITVLAQWAGSFDPSLCPPSATFESIAQQIRQASDILSDGTQDPAKTCNGISIGLGFDADLALLGGVFDPIIPPDPCQ